MFCAFQGSANILRLYGRGRVVGPHRGEVFRALQAISLRTLGARSIIVIGVSRIADSCGWGVPRLKYGEGERAINWTFGRKSAGQTVCGIISCRRIPRVSTVCLALDPLDLVTLSPQILLAADYICALLAFADYAETVAADQHFCRAEPRIVVGGFSEAVRSRSP